MLISEDYRRLQQELHKNMGYGQASVDLAPYVAEVIRRDHIEEMLDYGAGKGRLGAWQSTAPRAASRAWSRRFGASLRPG